MSGPSAGEGENYWLRGGWGGGRRESNADGVSHEELAAARCLLKSNRMPGGRYHMRCIHVDNGNVKIYIPENSSCGKLAHWTLLFR